jgi:predicted ATPase
LASKATVLFLLEDAHWADPTTLEMLTQAFQRLEGLRVLFLITFRPEFMSPWSSAGQAISLSLSRFDRRESRYLIEAVTDGKTLPVEVVEQILSKTDGIPLFIEELTKMVVGSGLVHEEAGQYVLSGSLPPLSIPTTLQGSLMARLDRLGPAKEVAQIGAAIGRQFSYDLIESVARMPAPALRDALRHLIDSELIMERKDAAGPIYVFKHALVQDTAYTSLLRGRRHSIHAAIARTLLERATDRLESAPEIVAHHLTAADKVDAAVRYWLRAAELALSRSANTEAARYAEMGLTLVERLAEGAERQQLELALQVARGNASLGIKGYTTSVRWKFRTGRPPHHVSDL